MFRSFFLREMSFISDFVCQICSKVFKRPVTFPCGCTVCGEHLHEEAALKTNRIKCAACNIEHNVTEDKFNPNRIIESLLSKNLHLSDREKTKRLELEQAMLDLYRLCDELREAKSLLDVEVYDHFQELRRQMDVRREEAKARIDHLYMEMIEMTHKTEAQFVDYLKEQVGNVVVEVRSQDRDDLEKEKQAFEEQLRDPQLLAQTLNDGNTKQSMEIARVKKNFRRFDAIKKMLKENEFTAGAVLFSKEMFGALSLVEPSRFSCLFKSTIVNAQQWSDLMKVCEFSLEDKWTLLYRASEHGFGAKNFHSKCDGHFNTLTLIEVDGSPNIFGGFTSAAWESIVPLYGNKPFILDANSFIFSLVNKDNQPVKMKLNDSQDQYSIGCYAAYGPQFGQDITIDDNSNANRESYCNLGHSFTHPEYKLGTIKARNFLAGSYNFQVSDIEVYARN